MPPCEAFPDGLVITGSNDNTILGYNLQDATVQITLEGHENVVCNVTPGREFGILLRLVTLLIVIVVNFFYVAASNKSFSDQFVLIHPAVTG